MRKKSIAAVLAILLGSLGIHKFYLGCKAVGFFYLIFCWTGIPAVLGVIDGIILLVQSEDAFNLKYNNENVVVVNSKYADAKYVLEGVNGKLFVYDSKVVIEHGGVLGTMTHGFSGNKTLPMKSIQSIQYREGGIAVNGYIQFAVLGGNERQGGISGAIDDENSIVFTKKSNSVALEIKNFIEDKIFGDANAATVVNQVSSADEILKLKSLLDNGIISEAEFENKKSQLLK